MIGFLALSALVLWATARLSVESSHSQLRQNSSHLLELYRKALESELERHAYLPLTLAGNRDVIGLLLNSGNYPRQYDLNLYLERISRGTDALAVYLLDREGNTLASSNWRSDTSYVGHNYSFRPYFQQAMRGNSFRYFAIGATTHIPGLFISYPVKLGGQVIGVVAIKVSMASLEKAWAVEGAERVAVSDNHGIVFASNVPDWLFRSSGPLSAQQIAQLELERKYQQRRIEQLGLQESSFWGIDGGRIVQLPAGPAGERSTRYLLQQVQLAETPWTLSIFTPLTPLVQTLIQRLTISVTLLLVLLMLIGVVWQRHRSRLEQSRLEQLRQQQLKERDQQQKAIIDHTGAGLILTDESGRILDLNSTVVRLLGLYGRQVVGQPLASLLAERDRSRLQRAMKQLYRNGQQSPLLELHPKYGETDPVELQLSRLLLQDQVRLLITVHDIRQLKWAQAALKQAHDQLEQRVQQRTRQLQQAQQELIQSSKLAALGQMSAGIAHELNQPLAALRTFASSGGLLLQRQQYDQARVNFERIGALAERVGRLTGQLKILARKNSGGCEAVELSTALDAALEVMGPMLQQGGVRLIRKLPAALPPVWAESVQLEQVLINLLSNACDAVAEVAQPTIELSVAQRQTRLVIRIRDNGVGITEQQRPHLFDPFFTTKEVGQGLGLGLAIVDGIIRSWGGTIEAEPQPRGAVFKLQLPTESAQQLEDLHEQPDQRPDSAG